jgi:hypothetical protein
MVLIAILFPGLSFLIRGKILTFILCVILQLTLIGWIPSAIWALVSLNNERQEKRLIELERKILNANKNK